MNTASTHIIIDIVIKSTSGLHHISRVNYKGIGLYDVPLTYDSGVDLHTSYHPSGEMHHKLTKGNLIAAGEQIIPLGEANYEDNVNLKAKEVLIWKKKGQKWDSLRGIEEINPHNSFTNVNSLFNGYPIYSKGKADYIFEIDAESFPSAMIDIKTFLVEPGKEKALEYRIQQFLGCWNNDNLNTSLYPNEHVVLEKSELFTDRNPWLAIVLFVRKAKS